MNIAVSTSEIHAKGLLENTSDEIFPVARQANADNGPVLGLALYIRDRQNCNEPYSTIISTIFVHLFRILPHYVPRVSFRPSGCSLKPRLHRIDLLWICCAGLVYDSFSHQFHNTLPPPPPTQLNTKLPMQVSNKSETTLRLKKRHRCSTL